MARSYASLKLLGSTGVALLLLLLAEPLSTLVQLPPENGATLLRIGALVMWATLLNALPGTVLHALTLFRRLITVQLINVALTVLLMTALWLAARLNVATALLVGGVTAAVAALVSVAFLPEEWRRSIGLTLNARRELFGENSRRLLGFSRWMWVSQIFTILSVQIDVLLLGFFLPLPAVGIYALARNLAQKAGAVNQTLHTVLAPGASSLSTANQRRDYVRRSLVRSGLLAALILLAMPLARPFILFVYGQEYAASVNLFLALLLLVLFDLLVSPLFLLALPLDRPGLLALADGAQVAALLLVGIIAVPLFGAYGIVVARIAGRVVAGLVALPPLLLSVRLPDLRDERP